MDMPMVYAMDMPMVDAMDMPMVDAMAFGKVQISGGRKVPKTDVNLDVTTVDAKVDG